MSDALTFVPFDIETAGFELTDPVTVVGFDLEMGSRVLVHTDGNEADSLEKRVRERSGATVVVSTHPSESGLLEAIEGFVGDRLRGQDVLLVAYNGETYTGGFDLPFLRTRCAARDVRWPFLELPYADLMPIVTDRFNTTVNGEAQSDLAGTYAALLDGPWGELDPFAESDEAVASFQNGQFGELVMHNLADIRRTTALAGLIRRYCSRSDVSMKSLTPINHE